jgi:CPA1 family monovalent cation:H+ antiporter
MDFLDFVPSAAEESGLIQAELGFVLLLSIAALVAIISRRIRLPYTVALVIVGLALSFVPNPFEFDLSSELILALLVPPLIFEATLNIRWERLRQNLAPILLLAVFGTLISTFIVGTIVLGAKQILVSDLHLPFAAAIAFGALISATDPVAVISLFRDLGVTKRLGILVEGESLFNDGVAIVIFNIALAAGLVYATGEGEGFNLASGLIDFFRISIGGLVVGAILGFLVSSVVLKNVDDNLIETATTVALAFGSFILAEQLHVSGLLAVVAAGISVGNIGMQNTSPTTKITLDNFWEFLAFVVNSFVFLLIGLEAHITQLQGSLSIIIVAVIAVLFSRSVVVYSLTWLHGRLDTNHRIPVNYRHVMYWGGLRGAISLALALSLTGAVFGTEAVSELRLMTFGVVLFTLLVQGTTIGPLLRRLKLTDATEQEREIGRRQAMVYAVRAGKMKLDTLFHDGILSAEVYEAMTHSYRLKMDESEQGLRDMLVAYPELEQTMILEARRDLIRAERSAFGDASRLGLITEEVYNDLIKETDKRFAALALIKSAMSQSEQEEGQEG